MADPPAGYCGNKFGGAVRVEVLTDVNEVILAATETVRLTYGGGGSWDGFGSPWYAPVANVLEAEIVTTDTRWRPTSGPANRYLITPWRSRVRVWLAVENGLGPGVWSEGLAYAGWVTRYQFQPNADGSATVRLTCTDIVTTLADATVGELAEQQGSVRLAALLAGVKGIQDETGTGAPYGPTMGRTHPEQGLTRLVHAAEVAEASGRALIVQAATSPTDPSVIAIAHAEKVRDLGSVGTMWAMCRDPDQPISNPVTGAALAQKPACLTDLLLARPDDGFRTKLRVARRVARWRAKDYVLSAGWGPLGANQTDDHRVGPFVVEVGDAWVWTSRLPPVTIAPAAGPFTYRAYQASQLTGQFWWPTTAAALTNAAGTQITTRFEAVTADPWWLMGRWLTTAAGVTAQFPANPADPFHEWLEREPGVGPTISATVTAAEGTYGSHTADGLQSPIARQVDLVTWATDAASWCSSPQLLADVSRCEITAGHADPGGVRMVAAIRPGDGMLIRYAAGPPGFDLWTWVAAFQVTITAESWLIDVVTAPRIGPALPPGDVVVGSAVLADLEASHRDDVDEVLEVLEAVDVLEVEEVPAA